MIQPINVMIRNVGLAIRNTLIRRFLWTNQINIRVDIIQKMVIPRNVLLKIYICIKILCIIIKKKIYVFNLCIHINCTIQLVGPLQISHPSQHLWHEYFSSISFVVATGKRKYCVIYLFCASYMLRKSEFRVYMFLFLIKFYAN